MVSNKKQQLSAWMDNELSPQELAQFERVSNEQASDSELEAFLSEELSENWQGYHLAGEALRNELPPQMDLDFADKVSAAISREPAHSLAPTTIQDQQSADVVEMPAPKHAAAATAPRKSNVIPLLGKFGQYGIAASVAAALVIGVQQFNGGQTGEQPLPVLQTMPVGGYAAPVSLQAEPASQVQQRIEQNQRIEQQRRLNAFLQDHRLQQRLKSQAEEKKASER